MVTNIFVNSILISIVRETGRVNVIYIDFAKAFDRTDQLTWHMMPGWLFHSAENVFIFYFMPKVIWPFLKIMPRDHSPYPAVTF